MKLGIVAQIGLFAFITVNTAWSHIDDLKVNGVLFATANKSLTSGEVFAPDQKVSLSWDVTIAHTDATTYISYSINGSTWVQITTFPGNTNNLGLKTYSWTLPNLNSNKVQLRIYQAHVPSSNPPNTISDDYNLVSGNFTIQPKSMGIADSHLPKLIQKNYRAMFRVNGAQISNDKLSPGANNIQFIVGK